MASTLTIVTGSSRGLGAAMLRRLMAPGAVLIGVARRSDPALDAEAAVQGARLDQWTHDLAESLPLAQRLRERLGGFAPDQFDRATLINNAGVVSSPAPVSDIALAETAAALRAGLEATVLLSAAFLDATRAWTGARRLLNISSGLGRRGMAGSAAYCAAKAGMDNFSRAVALEEAARPNGARVVSLAPGVIDTDMQVQLRSADPARFAERAAFLKLKETGQLLSPEAAATRVLAWLEQPAFGEQPVADVRDA
jgi:NAD(P)-dependent dehydrogenase (short-subunit alcohol dehydrogenase family)